MIRKTIVIGVVLVLGLLALTSPLSAESPAHEGRGMVMGEGALTSKVISQMLGYELDPDQEVGLIKYTPEPVRESMSWKELAARLDETAFGHSGTAVPTDHPACVPLCGADVGYGEDEGFWAFPCDDSSAFIGYDKTLGPGATYVAAVDSGTANVEVCDGFYGPTMEWEVTMSVLHIAPLIISDGCYSDVWELHDDGFCPGRGSGLSTFNSWQVSGPGARVTLDLPSMWLDYFVGKHADTRYA